LPSEQAALPAQIGDIFSGSQVGIDKDVIDDPVTCVLIPDALGLLCRAGLSWAGRPPAVAGSGSRP